MHRSPFDGFCLVSSDSDFTRLAHRIREQGPRVYGFGAQKTAESFRKACTAFFPTERLTQAAAPKSSNGQAKRPSVEPVGSAVPILTEGIIQTRGKDGWANLGSLGKYLKNLPSGFSVKTYGASNSVTLIERTDAFQIDRLAGGAVRVRIKT